jgi:hypothetical protein
MREHDQLDFNGDMHTTVLIARPPAGLGTCMGARIDNPHRRDIPATRALAGASHEVWPKTPLNTPRRRILRHEHQAAWAVFG